MISQANLNIPILDKGAPVHPRMCTNKEICLLFSCSWLERRSNTLSNWYSSIQVVSGFIRGCLYLIFCCSFPVKGRFLFICNIYNKSDKISAMSSLRILRPALICGFTCPSHPRLAGMGQHTFYYTSPDSVASERANNRTKTSEERFLKKLPTPFVFLRRMSAFTFWSGLSIL